MFSIIDSLLFPTAATNDRAFASFIDKFDLPTFPPDSKKQGHDWSAAFNPETKRALDVSMFHSLAHERLVISLSSTSTITGIPGLILHPLC